jgi:hypothetical protein
MLVVSALILTSLFSSGATAKTAQAPESSTASKSLYERLGGA